MWTTLAKWLTLAAFAVALFYFPMKYVDSVRAEGYSAGREAASAECQTKAVKAAEEAEALRIMTVRTESETATILANQLAKQRRDAQTLQGKLDEALKKQPEVAGCFLNNDVTDLLRFGANGDFAAVEQHSNTISGPPVDEMSRGATVPGGARNANFTGTSQSLFIRK